MSIHGPRPTGYSGAPLAKKLGLKEGSRLHWINAPPELPDLLGPLPAGARRDPRLAAETDLIHVFAVQRTALAQTLADLRSRIRPDAAVWVSWPKRTAKVATDLTEDVIREVALPLGFVDIKVCAVSPIWSGLKLVIRKALR